MEDWRLSPSGLSLLSPGPIFMAGIQSKIHGTILLHLYLCPASLFQQNLGSSTASNSHPISMQTLWFQGRFFILPPKWTRFNFSSLHGLPGWCTTANFLRQRLSLTTCVSADSNCCSCPEVYSFSDFFLMWLNKKPNVLTNTLLRYVFFAKQGSVSVIKLT